MAASFLHAQLMKEEPERRSGRGGDRLSNSALRSDVTPQRFTSSRSGRYSPAILIGLRRMTGSTPFRVVIVLVALMPPNAAARQTVNDGAILEPGKTVERPLSIGEKQSYSIKVGAGDYVRVRILPLGA